MLCFIFSNYLLLSKMLIEWIGSISWGTWLEYCSLWLLCPRLWGLCLEDFCFEENEVVTDIGEGEEDDDRAREPELEWERWGDDRVC